MEAAISIVALILTVLGSLGVFLLGMKLISEALQKVAGERLKSLLAKMTSNRFSGVLTGLAVTGVLQSSSATTVIVVSFVSAGLFTLT
ncbi:MAG TPA: Na/Pi symporter, partial [Polyangiaceae bacterium]|nr:Na/Pi symporter [Polyangiaceae bacterium]